MILPQVGRTGSPNPSNAKDASRKTNAGTEETNPGISKGIMRGMRYRKTILGPLAPYARAASMYIDSFTCTKIERYALIAPVNILSRIVAPRITQMLRE